jgi:AraC family transcriptional activator of pyochelin receptor
MNFVLDGRLDQSHSGLLKKQPYTSGYHNCLYFESIVLQLLCYQCEQLFPLKQTAEPVAVKLPERDKLFHAREILLARLGDPPALSILAREAQSNKFSLKKEFKELFVTTVFGFVLQERMKHARYSLYAGEKTISEIAYELGYSHPQHFHRVFKSFLE